MSRWKGPSDLSLARDAAPLFKSHGAIAAYVGTRYSGQHTGQGEVALIFPDWETYGYGKETMMGEPDYPSLLAEVTASFDLQDRAIIVCG